MDVMVGYPEKFRDYSKLQMKADDLYGNVKRSAAFEWDYQLSDLGKPVDRKKWAMSPATVNAYNGGAREQDRVPGRNPAAAVLRSARPTRPSIMARSARSSAMRSCTGSTTRAARSTRTARSATGGPRPTPTRFKALTDALGKQYASYEAAPGVFINGDLTMGENIGDMSGLEVAYEAYKMSLGGKPAPVIDGLTGDQRFFLAFAQAWRGEQRDDAIKTQVATDPHSPRRYRIIGPLRNLDAWYSAFDVKPGSKFYIPPEKRVRIW